MSKPKLDGCETCYYWSREGTPVDSMFGHCLRYAPRPGINNYGIASWPETTEDAWCGEWTSE